MNKEHNFILPIIYQLKIGYSYLSSKNYYNVTESQPKHSDSPIILFFNLDNPNF